MYNLVIIFWIMEIFLDPRYSLQEKNEKSSRSCVLAGCPRASAILCSMKDSTLRSTIDRHDVGRKEINKKTARSRCLSHLPPLRPRVGK